MNYPHYNKLQLKHLAEIAERSLGTTTYCQDAARQALKMKAALELVLMFHSAEPWTSERVMAWSNLQIDAGVEQSANRCGR